MRKAGLNVFAADVAAGRLERSDPGPDTFLFTYSGRCPPAQAVSLTMPVRADQYDASGGLVAIFEMNLPEGALRERLRLNFAKAIAEFDDLDSGSQPIPESPGFSPRHSSGTKKHPTD